jgi:hypothetical protein
MSDDRIAKLSQRFTKHAVGRRPTTGRARERRSYYIATEITERIDRIYRDVNHELYPQSVSKSLFLETVIEYGLAHLDELKPLLVDPEAGDSTTPS